METSVVFTDTICDGHLSEVFVEDTPFHGKSSDENHEKNCAVWSEDSIIRLLRLYETKLGLLTTPKKKTRIWIAISDNLKDYNIEVSPNQVRWKINALTKKYKQCIKSGQHNRFKYFTELNNIYAQDDENFYTASDLIKNKCDMHEDLTSPFEHGMQQETKAIIELRKNRLADKIESDKCQSKVQLEKQWLEYLKRQEDLRLLKDEICERNLKIRHEELELRKRELEIKESLDIRRLQLTEQEQDKLIKLEKEKCEMLKKILIPKV